MDAATLNGLTTALYDNIVSTRNKLAKILDSYRVNLYEKSFIITKEQLLNGFFGQWYEDENGWSLTPATDYLGYTYTELNEDVYKLSISDFGLYKEREHFLRVYSNGLLLEKDSYYMEHQQGSLLIYIRKNSVAENDKILVTIDRILTLDKSASYHYIDSSVLEKIGREYIYHIPVADIGGFLRELSDLVIFEVAVEGSLSSKGQNFSPVNFDYELSPKYTSNELTHITLKFFSQSERLLDRLKENKVVVINSNYFVEKRIKVSAITKEIEPYLLDFSTTTNIIPIVSTYKGDLDIYVNGLHLTENIDYTIERKIIGSKYIGNKIIFTAFLQENDVVNIFKVCSPVTIMNHSNGNLSSQENITQVSSQVSISDIRLLNSSLFTKGIFLLDDTDLPIGNTSIRYYSNGRRYCNADLEVYGDNPADRLLYVYSGEEKLSPVNLEIKAQFVLPTITNIYVRETFLDYFPYPDDKEINVLEDLILFYKDLVKRVKNLEVPEELLMAEEQGLPLVTSQVIKAAIEVADPVDYARTPEYMIADTINYTGFDPLLPLAPIADHEFKTFPTLDSVRKPYMWDEDFSTEVLNSSNFTDNCLGFYSNMQNLIHPTDLVTLEYSMTGEITLRVILTYTSISAYNKYNTILNNLEYLYIQHKSSLFFSDEIIKVKITNIDSVDGVSTTMYLLVPPNSIVEENENILLYTTFNTVQSDNILSIDVKNIATVTEKFWKSLKKGERFLIRDNDDSQDFILSFISYSVEKKELSFYCNSISYSDIYNLTVNGYKLYRGKKPWFPKKGFPESYINPFPDNKKATLTQLSLDTPYPCKGDEYYEQFGNSNDQTYKFDTDLEDYQIKRFLSMFSKAHVNYAENLKANSLNESAAYREYLNGNEWARFLNKAATKRFLNSPAYQDYLNSDFLVNRLNFITTNVEYLLYAAFQEYYRSGLAEQWQIITNSKYFKNSYYYKKVKEDFIAAYHIIIDNSTFGASIRELSESIKLLITNFVKGMYTDKYLITKNSQLEDYSFDTTLSVAKADIESYYRIKDKSFHDHIIKTLRPFLNINMDTVISDRGLLEYFSLLIGRTVTKEFLDFSNSGLNSLVDFKLLDFSSINSELPYILNLSRNNITDINEGELPNIAPYMTANGENINYAFTVQSIDLTYNPLSTAAQVFLIKQYIESGKRVQFDDTVSIFKESKLNMAATIQNSSSKNPVYLRTHRYLKESLAEYDNERIDDIKVIKVADSKIIDISGIEYCKNLEELVLKENLIFELPLDLSWSSLKRLRIVDLSKNYRLTESEFLDSCFSLEEIYLNDTMISKIGFCENFWNLRVLNISNTRVSDFSSISRGLDRLEYVNLDNTQTIDISYLFSLKNLKYLSVSNAFLDGTFVAPISSKSNIEYLDLSANTLTDQILLPIYQLKKVKELYLNNNALTEFQLYSLDLEVIDISSNSIIKIQSGFDSVDIQSAKLKIFDISSNSIGNSEELFAFLSHFPDLYKIGLRNIGITTIDQDTFTTYFRQKQEIDLRGNDLDRASQLFLNKLNKEMGYSILFVGNKIYNMEKNTLTKE